VYRLRKFAARHRRLLTAAGAVAASMIAGLIFAMYGLFEARRERDEAVLARTQAIEHREVASKEAAKARAVNQFVQDLFRSIEPQNARGREVTVREVFERANEKLAAGSMRGQPEIEGAIRHTLGRTYHMLGWIEPAIEQYRTALALRQAAFPNDHADMVETLHWLGSVLTYWGERDEAYAYLRQSLDMRRRLGIYDDPDTADTLGYLAQTRRQDPVSYEAFTREALEIRERWLGRDHPSVGLSLGDLAFLDASMGCYDAAVEKHSRVVEIHRKAYPPDSPHLAGTLYAMGRLMRVVDQPAQAEPFLVEALGTYRLVFGSRSHSVLRALQDLASSYVESARWPDAERTLCELLAILESDAVLQRSPMVIETHVDLGNCLRHMGRFGEAEPLLREAYDSLAEDAPGRREVAGQLRQLYLDWERPEDAARFEP
jgi:tetratricopeptide (TPR) repeat protein